MYINEADIDHVAAPYGDPGLPNPFDLDAPVDQNVKVRVPALLKFEDSDVLRRAPVVALQVDPQLGKRRIQVGNGIALDL